MAIRYYVSTEEASFFNNNRMGYANSIPTEGNYKVGDFIISSTQENGVFGWVCTVAGNPGEWEVIGSGMNNGSSNDEPNTKIVGYVNAVSFDDARSSVEIGIDGYKKGIDFLEVHYNGLLLAEGVHYNVSADGKSIVAIDDVWNENADDTQQMIFRVLKSEGINVSELKNTVNIDSACYEVEIGIEGFNPEKDVVEVHLNGVLLVQGVDYEIVEDRISKLDRSEAWNPYNVNRQKMFVKVFRNNANLVEPAEGSVTMDKLADDVKEDLAAIDGLVATVGMQNNTISNLNDRVSAIEEKIESGDIVTNGGGGGGPVKLTYKDNLVEVVNTNTVVIGLPFNKEKDMLEVHIDGLKLAEGVHYNISEDGKSIVKVEGVWNPDSLDDQYIDFRVISAGNEQIEHLTRNVEFSSPMTEVGIELEYKHGVDILIVHLNGIKLVEGLDFDYVAEGNKIVKIDTSEPWNLYGVDGQLFVIDVLRNVGEKVTMDGLADDVKQAIEAAGNIDITGKQDVIDNNLATTNKTIVGAINEVFQSGNNVKQNLVDALIAKGVSCSTSDSFESLISKIINNLSSSTSTNLDVLVTDTLPNTVVENKLVVISSTSTGIVHIAAEQLAIGSEIQEGDILIQCTVAGIDAYQYVIGDTTKLIMNVANCYEVIGGKYVEVDLNVGKDNEWLLITNNTIIFYDNGTYPHFESKGEKLTLHKKSTSEHGSSTVTESTEDIYIYISDKGYTVHVLYGSANKIDLSKYSKLILIAENVEWTDTSNTGISLGITNSITLDSMIKSITVRNGTNTLDITNVNETAYCMLQVKAYNTYATNIGPGYATLIIKKMWLE